MLPNTLSETGTANPPTDRADVEGVWSQYCLIHTSFLSLCFVHSKQ
jgi:hypothetical protein